jgi:hypothetical protein
MQIAVSYRRSKVKNRKWDPFMNIGKDSNVLVLTAGMLILAIYYSIFSRFFPNDSGCLGHDYSFYLPALLDGFFWFNSNGLWKIPWFTPSFCGGSLNYLNVSNGYYTVPQFLTFVTDPVAAVRITFAMFAGLGFWGFYLLLRGAFFFSRPISFLCSVCFLFNGFFVHRMIIGHLCYINLVLIPLIAFFLLRPIPDTTHKAWCWRLIFDCILSGLLFSIMIQAGFGSFMIPAIILILVIGLIHGLLNGRQWAFWSRLAGAGFSGMLFCSSKLIAICYILNNFPRSDYSLPGVKGFFCVMWLVFKSLFISPAVDSDRMGALVNVQWAFERHEWEYDVTFVPLLLILFGLGSILRRINFSNLISIDWRRWLQTSAITVLLMIPIAVNAYSPDWNELLKTLPLIKNSSNLIRWFIVYIPFVIIVSGLAFEKSKFLKAHQLTVMLIGIIAVICLKGCENRDFYQRQAYNPDEIVKAYYEVKEGLWTPEIDAIGVYLNKDRQAIKPLYANNLFVHRMSQLFCYEPLFGYRLENFPMKGLHLGSAMEENQGVLNIKNPACYVWPEANNCKPGAHFTTDQKDAANAFLNFRPYSFNVPIAQKIADWTNGLSLIVAFIFLVAYSVRTAWICFRRQKDDPQKHCH